MKKIYEAPKGDIIEINLADIITTSWFDDVVNDDFGDVGPSWFG